MYSNRARNGDGPIVAPRDMEIKKTISVLAGEAELYIYVCGELIITDGF